MAEGALALVLLIGAQYAVVWTALRSRPFRDAVKSAPTLLVWQGRLRDRALREQRVSRAEILQAVRSQSLGGLDHVTAVVLETDGSFSVIPAKSAGDLGALDNVPDVHRE